MEKFKVCPVCGMRNKPNMIECSGCETDLTGVKVTDEDGERKEQKQQLANDIVSDQYVRICDCG